MLHQHVRLFAWLAATTDWATPLHHLTIVPPERARALLRDGADVRSARAPGCVTPLDLARKLHEAGKAPPGSTAQMVMRAALPWSCLLYTSPSPRD